MRLTRCKHHQHQSLGGGLRILVFDYIDYKKAKMRTNRARRDLSGTCLGMPPQGHISWAQYSSKSHTPTLAPLSNSRFLSYALVQHHVGKARSLASRRAPKLVNQIRIAVWATRNVNLSRFDLMRADQHLAVLKSSPREARAVLKHVHKGLFGIGGARWPVRSPWGADLMKLARCKHHQHQSSWGLKNSSF